MTKLALAAVAIPTRYSAIRPAHRRISVFSLEVSAGLRKYSPHRDTDTRRPCLFTSIIHRSVKLSALKRTLGTLNHLKSRGDPYDDYDRRWLIFLFATRIENEPGKVRLLARELARSTMRPKATRCLGSSRVQSLSGLPAIVKGPLPARLRLIIMPERNDGRSLASLKGRKREGTRAAFYSLRR